MPALTNVRYELFARSLAIGMKPVDACAGAGFKRSSTTASTLARKPEVILRVQELIDEVHLSREEKRRQIDAKTQADELGINDEWVLEHLKLNVELAQDAGQFGPAHATLKTIGAYLEMMDKDGAPVKRKDDPNAIQNRPESPNLDALSDALGGDDEDEDDDRQHQLAEEDEQEEMDLADIEDAMPDDPEDADLIDRDGLPSQRGEHAKKVN